MPHPWESRWNTSDKLGHGGQGVTYRVAEINAPNRTGVLKYLKNNKSPVARQRMGREFFSLQLLAELGGKVPQVYDHNTSQIEDTNVELFLVMELIEGPTLNRLIENNGPRSLEEAIAIVLALCETVKIAHSENILHRDIKPDNIIVRDVGTAEVYFVDFGLSFNDTTDALTEIDETFRNKFLDLPETVAPGGNRRDPRSDVTALCAILYYILTGKNPGHLQDDSGKMPHLRPDSMVRDVLKADARAMQVELILSCGLNPKLANRFQSVDDLISRLIALRSQASVGAGDPFALAALLSGQIRQLDRTTQLREMTPIAGSMVSAAFKTLKAYKKLDQFKLDVSETSDYAPKDFMAELDRLPPGINVKVEVLHHQQACGRIYKMGARGEQCVVCVRNWTQENPAFGVTNTPWYEIAGFDGAHTQQIIDAVEADFKLWLNTSLEYLFQKILSPPK